MLFRFFSEITSPDSGYNNYKTRRYPVRSHDKTDEKGACKKKMAFGIFSENWVFPDQRKGM
jgi:hypothetical protein